jgi:zeaxanthin glucosyltransferase
MERNENTKKGTVLLVLYPELSKVNVTFRLAGQLKNRGWRVVYIGPSHVEAHIRMQGFDYKVMEPDSAVREQAGKALGNSLGNSLGESKGRTSWRRRYIERRLEMLAESRARAHMLAQAGQWIQEMAPDLVLLDTLVWQYSVPFLALRVPILLINSCLTSEMNWRIPPVFSGLVPGKSGGLFSRSRNLWGWVKIVGSYYAGNLKQKISDHLAFGSILQPAEDALRPELQVKALGAKLRRGEYGYRLQLPQILLSPPEFDFPSAVAARRGCYAGTCIEPDRIEPSFEWEGIDPEKPLVYCSTGSHPWMNRDRLYGAAVEAIRQRPHLQMILKVNDAEEARRLEPLPENVVVVQWVPQLNVLSRASLFITHGGFGSVKESIYYGVPMMVFPCGMDQPGMAARVRYHGLGLAGNIREVNAGSLGSDIDRISGDPGFKKSLKKMQGVFRRQLNCQKGLDYIEGFIRDSKGIKS